MAQATRLLPADNELGQLGVAHVARMWARALAGRQNRPSEWTETDKRRDRIVLDGLGLGLEPTTAWLWQTGPTLEEFEAWILRQKGGALDPVRVRRVNSLILGEAYDHATTARIASIDAAAPVLGPAGLTSWAEKGYVVVPDAIAPDERMAVEAAVWDYLDISPDDPSRWYPASLNGIMVQLFQHSALEVARCAPRIHKAFAELWGTADLLVTTDRCGFNPPERHRWRFPGPRLHFDVLLEPPIPFGVQGLIYLTETASNQGAFTCVPGFHREIDRWLIDDPSRQSQTAEVMSSLVAVPIPGRAGDLIMWHQALPHGSSPNRADRPRIVQYLTMAPP
jgi:Phytanoyl-CoA dioxygenase (PhyH)